MYLTSLSHLSPLFLLGTSYAITATASTSVPRTNTHGPLSSASNEPVLITTAEGLIEFSKEVNGGKNYSGKTVYLGADIDFTKELSEKFSPIGHNNYFLGSFDGRGHVISNLAIENAKYNFGLFGYSRGIAIRNVVLGPSCSVNATSSSSVYAGGIMGECKSVYSECLIENAVNMADISTEIKGYNSYMGGIIGMSSISNYGGTIRNCANYGNIHVVQPKRSSSYYVGGIAGYTEEYFKISRAVGSVKNCVNAGEIQYNGSNGTLYAGGICGYFEIGVIKNCVNTGTVQSQLEKYVGAIVGYLGARSSWTTVENCYWDGNSSSSCVGEKDPRTTIKESAWFDDTTFELNESVSAPGYKGNSLIDALNAFASQASVQKYSKWLLNADNSLATFEISGRSASLVAVDSQLILMPDLANSASTVFGGWYTDAGCTVPFAGPEISEDVMLYGLEKEDRNKYTVAFDTQGGLPVEQITAECGSVVMLPNVSKRLRYEFLWWETDSGDAVFGELAMPPYNITLHAVWLSTSISTPQEFIDFSNIVYFYGKEYSGTTVYLDADIDFSGGLSEKLNDTSEFCGTFDGQGHVIRNLVYRNVFNCVGLFPNPTDLTVRNVVMDSSCSYPVSRIYEKYGNKDIGGIVGLFKGSELLIENCVSMANISVDTLLSSRDPHIYIGGILGRALYEHGKETIKNCANYGNIKIIGKVMYSGVGGIAGSLTGLDAKVMNCINYGAVNPASGEEVYLGGIVGLINVKDSVIENCVNAGSTKYGLSDFAGAIVGYNVKNQTKIAHCFWTSECWIEEAVGSGTIVVDTHNITISEQSVKDLNDYQMTHEMRNWNKWVHNKDKGNVTFVIKHDGNAEARWTAVGSELLLLASPADDDDEDKSFSGWFTDSSYDTHLTAPAISGAEAVLYGRWCDITVTFDAGDVFVSPDHKGVIYGKTYGELPVPEKVGHTFVGWDTEKGVISNGTVVAINESHTAHAIIVINNYTLTFDFKNKNVVSSLVTFNDTIVYPEAAKRTGYSFRWNDTIERMPAHDVTISAVWTMEQSLLVTLIAVPIVVFVVVVIVVIVIVVVIYKRKNKKKTGSGNGGYDDDDDDLRKPLGSFSSYGWNEETDDEN